MYFHIRLTIATGISDFRGPNGLWTKTSQGKSFTPSISMLQAIPSYSHMAIVELVESGLCKYVVSQNCDGLHLRSGLPKNFISELHGNTNLEKCFKCGKEYLRDFECDRENYDVHDHSTGRKCSVKGCGAELNDTIINFGEQLPKEHLLLSRDHSKKADLCLVLGSSLTVVPASKIATDIGEDKRNLVICNLQKTDYDDLCVLRIFGKTDEFMSKLMGYLQLKPKEFKLQRRVNMGNKDDINFIHSVDEEGTPYSFWKRIQLIDNVLKDPFEWKGKKESTHLVFHPFGNYKEFPFEFVHDFSHNTSYLFEYYPSKKNWIFYYKKNEKWIQIDYDKSNNEILTKK